MTRPEDPQAALDAIRQVRADLAPDVRIPLVWEAGYGGLCGALVAGQALPTPASTAVLVLVLLGLGVYVHLWREHAGWWVNGYGPRRARWIGVGLALVLTALIALSFWLRSQGHAWGALVTFPLGFAAAVVGGRLWMKVWRAELRSEVR